MNALGEAAVDLPWLAPGASSLVALARNPSSAVWGRVRNDPGLLLLLVRGSEKKKAEPFSLADALRNPDALETAVRLLNQPGFACWKDSRLAPVLSTCLHQAGLASLLAEQTSCDTDLAWIAGLLTPLGWLAMCASSPHAAATCLNDPELSQNSAAAQQRLWGLDHTAIARRLCRRWLLPSWLSTIIGHLGLPVGIARSLGVDPTLFQVVQLAVGLTQRYAGGLRLALGATVPELIQSLRISDQALETVLERSRVEAFPTLEDPAKVPLLGDLLALSLENHQRDDHLLVNSLQNEVERLQRALEDQCAGERGRLETLKLRALAETAAGAGHEINNPLAVISGQAQYILTREADPERTKSLKIIISQAHRIHQLVNDLMQFARPPSAHKQAVELPEFLRHVVSSLQEFAEQRRVRLGIAEGIEGQAFADPQQLRVILTSLLRNAIEAAPEDGWAGIRLERDDAELRLVVEDNGPGLTAVAQEHLFDPFYSGRCAGRGRGLGLSVAWRLAQQQKGNVRFEGHRDGITRFVVSLPLPEAAPKVDSFTSQAA